MLTSSERTLTYLELPPTGAGVYAGVNDNNAVGSEVATEVPAATTTFVFVHLPVDKYQPHQLRGIPAGHVSLSKLVLALLVTSWVRSIPGGNPPQQVLPSRTYPMKVKDLRVKDMLYQKCRLTLWLS
ncbi:hypothetical protein RvY_01898 [Ramazzottius varieornatus]|uniref:Uncharacterized protein n=1 Tax=Ramazzottius varieornatus TaxID=947166 RepID=A0A1D1UI00_RAMVA|nr:hypothetical protein RvY_01898 [Ramazzottius varieornatus]